MSSAYVIADVTVVDPVVYEAYKRMSSLAIKVHGAQVCVRGGPVEVLEGDWKPERVVVLKFPSMAQARVFHDSVEYRLARKAREGIAVMQMIVVEGAD